ncbi:pyridoxal phosphate-dependent aminotransferase [Pandoraea apista]|uniref:Pyridoxal phosphate-dependent aminotransferase n=1 Tax=Pandoraea apista TaxID=93218 RepID=A0ABX9ZV05_9BURK|nr:pyridoxal phosphate-dependent aminotransferase [Pandoraea apista]PTE01992.1 pyridoxal phosphate-dependent aminotransferase [Pandoraea apista]RRJ32934.1 pyridoxal phosphate-dependent aminotransferase [Pandoraea apista]RRJ81785.1 pyridoxal phosphate-dependent aminotransferase [Pandoraea apista]RSD11097.1 pyridoxal phosphate-dependent aminotransferase [Pandoraea apista]RSK86325.1 pyridoxal phosphate-dependent aminotransferase [Pandoraea apista]
MNAPTVSTTEQAKTGANQLPPEWRGRFPYNDIISLLEVNRTFNLAESTSQDLTFGEILDFADIESLRDLKLGYGKSAGALALREAIGQACNVPADNVVTTQGAALGLFLLAFEACRPGDEAVLVTPCFPSSRGCLVGAGVTVREVRLGFETGYRLDMNQMEAALSPKTRLVSLASPQNPSGVQTSRQEIEALLALMEKRCPQAVLFVDETYREATYGDRGPMESMAALDPRIVTGASVSKALGAPGLRTGWLTIADPDLRARIIVAKMNTIISGSVLDETLATAVLHHRQRVLAPRRRLLASALEALGAWCTSEAERIEWIRPDAGALCCVQLRADVFDDTAVSRFWALLPDHDLQLASGDWFGESRRVFRLGFGYLPPERLGAALSALSSVMTACLRS